LFFARSSNHDLFEMRLMLPSERVYLLAALLGQLRVPRLELTALNLYVLEGLPQFRTW
jgi:hypothetical protein